MVTDISLADMKKRKKAQEAKTGAGMFNGLNEFTDNLNKCMGNMGAIITTTLEQYNKIKGALPKKPDSSIPMKEVSKGKFAPVKQQKPNDKLNTGFEKAQKPIPVVPKLQQATTIFEKIVEECEQHKIKLKMMTGWGLLQAAILKKDKCIAKIQEHLE